jgi:hypothetical protein
LRDYKSKIKTISNDSIYILNNQEYKKLKINLSDYYFIDLYYEESQYKNLGDIFVYEINNNILFQNLYFLKDFLKYKKVVKLKYYTKLNKVEHEYILDTIIKKKNLEKEFILPEYEYCFWNVFEDKKLMRKHRKRKRLENKKKQ